MAEDLNGTEQECVMREICDSNFSDNPNAAEIMQKFQVIVQNAELLQNSAEYLLDELIGDAIFGVILEVHHLRKTGNLVALDGQPENCDNFDNNLQHNNINNNNNNNNSNNNSNSNTTNILPLNSSLHTSNTDNNNVYPNI